MPLSNKKIVLHKVKVFLSNDGNKDYHIQNNKGEVAKVAIETKEIVTALSSTRPLIP